MEKATPAAPRLLACSRGVKAPSNLAPAKIGSDAWLTPDKQLKKGKLFSAWLSCSPAVSWNRAGMRHLSPPQLGMDGLVTLRGTLTLNKMYFTSQPKQKCNPALNKRSCGPGTAPCTSLQVHCTCAWSWNVSVGFKEDWGVPLTPKEPPLPASSAWEVGNALQPQGA